MWRATLDALVRNPGAPQDIDFLSIDIEVGKLKGHELKVCAVAFTTAPAVCTARAIFATLQVRDCIPLPKWMATPS